MKIKLAILMPTLFVVSYSLFANVVDIPTDRPVKKSKTYTESVSKPVKGIASGVADVGKGAGKLVRETVKQTKEGNPIDGTVEGIKKGSQEAVDSTVKGAYKVATLGYGHLDTVEHEQPFANKDLDYTNPRKSDRPATIKIKIPGS